MRTRIFTWLFMLLVPVLCWANEEPPTEAIDGKTFYLLDSKEDLEWFRDYVNEGNPGACAKLTDNINLNPNFTFSEDGYSGSGTPEEWEPIMSVDMSTYEAGYAGIFDGGGYTISGLYIKKEDNLIGFNGLFGVVGTIDLTNTGVITAKNEDAIVRNLTVAGYMDCNDMGAGGITYNNVATIQNCTNKVCMLGTTSKNPGSKPIFIYIGGICSTNYGLIKGCSNKGNIESISITGGICSTNAGTIEECYNEGTIVSGEFYNIAIGGIAGKALDGEESCINNCYNAGMLKADQGQVAGISPVEWNPMTTQTNVTIMNCHNYTAITGETANKAGICTVFNHGNIKVTVSNNYYLEGVVDAGYLFHSGSEKIPNDQPGQTEAKSEDEFANGEVFYLLQQNNPDVWVQTIGMDDYPKFETEGEGSTIYQIAFDYNYEGSPEAIAYYIEEGESVTVPTMTRDGYIFTNWSTDKAGEIIAEISGSITPDASVTYYAQWQAEQTEEPEQPGDDDEEDQDTDKPGPIVKPIKYYNIYIDTICPGLEVEVSKDVVQEGHQVSAYLTIQAECDTTGMRFEYKRGLFGYWKDLKELEGVQPGEYIIKNIYTDIYIRALDATLPEEEPTGIEDLEGVKAYAKEGSIYVYTPNREQVTIISMSGAIIKHEEQVGLQSYSVSRGIYIVRIGDKVFKLKN